MEIYKIKKELQKAVGNIRKDLSEEAGRKWTYPKAMMTGQQEEKRTATVNCGGEWMSREFTEKLADQVMKDERFKTFLTKCDATARLEVNTFGTFQIRINY